MTPILYRISPASFPLVLGGRRIPKDHPDIYVQMSTLPTGQWLSRYYLDSGCETLLHETKSRTY